MYVCACGARPFDRCATLVNREMEKKTPLVHQPHLKRKEMLGMRISHLRCQHGEMRASLVKAPRIRAAATAHGSHSAFPVVPHEAADAEHDTFKPRPIAINESVVLVGSVSALSKWESTRSTISGHDSRRGRYRMSSSLNCLRGMFASLTSASARKEQRGAASQANGEEERRGTTRK